MRILLIDDDKDDQALFCEAIEMIAPQIDCEVADNGAEGIRRLTSTSELPILVFLDINMPVMNGWETLTAIRNNPVLKKTKVVMYTTSSQRSDKVQAESFGATFVSKSSSFETMIVSLSKVIRQESAEFEKVIVNRELK